MLLEDRSEIPTNTPNLWKDFPEQLKQTVGRCHIKPFWFRMGCYPVKTNQPTHSLVGAGWGLRPKLFRCVGVFKSQLNLDGVCVLCVYVTCVSVWIVEQAPRVLLQKNKKWNSLPNVSKNWSFSSKQHFGRKKATYSSASWIMFRRRERRRPGSWCCWPSAASSYPHDT